MDPTLLSLLDSIPQKPPRSKLETHRELIHRMRMSRPPARPSLL
jgi:hypothetical protein